MEQNEVKHNEALEDYLVLEPDSDIGQGAEVGGCCGNSNPDRSVAAHDHDTQLPHRPSAGLANSASQVVLSKQEATARPTSRGGTGNTVSVMEAIYHRRAVRAFTPQAMDPAVIRSLLDAAVQAPTAMLQEPWTFAVIQDRALLNSLSASAKEMVRSEAQHADSPQAIHSLELVNRPDFHIFYNAGTLIVICTKFQGPFVVADCWLAAENLMLAACAQGLGTCVIGFAVSALNTPEWKKKLNFPAETTAIAPIIVGVPAGETPPVPRQQANIVTWK